MAKVFNRVAVATATSGTGTVTLGSATSNATCTFAEAGVADGDVVTYLLTEGSDFEIGRGTYTSSGTTLSRTTVLLSKISGTSGTTKMTLAGSAEVRITAAAEDFTMGKQTVWVPAGAMTPRTTNGAAPGLVELTTNKNMLRTLDFDTTTQEFAQFEIGMPKSWNRGTVTFIPYWTAASGSGTVEWALQGVATSNDDAMDVAFGTEQTSADTLITANDNHLGPESSAITIAGTPASEDRVQFQIKRNVASDTLGVDAKLLGIRLIITTDAATDV